MTRSAGRRVRDHERVGEGDGGGAQRDQLDRHARSLPAPAARPGSEARPGDTNIRSVWSADGGRRTRSCTATRTSRSSTGRATPRSWPRRRPARARRRSRSPTTTGSTAWSASRRRRAPLGLPTVFGAELTLGGRARRPNGHADPAGRAPASCSPKGPAGYAALARAISEAQLRGREGRARSLALRRPRRGARDARDGRGSCSPGAARARCPPRSCATARPRPSARSRELVDAFGRDRVLVELWDHGDPLDRHRNDALAQLALRTGVEVVATNNVHYATPDRRPLATALAAVRSPALPRRDRRLAAGHAVRAPAQPGRAARRFAALARRGRAHRRDRGRVRVRPASSRRRTCPTTRCPTATPR